MDNPTGMPGVAAGSPPDGCSRPARRRHGAMGSRRVSESLPAPRIPPTRESREAGGIAGADATRPGLRSRRTGARTPAAGGEAPGSAAGPRRQAEQKPDFLAVNRKLHDLRKLSKRRCTRSAADKIHQAISVASRKVLSGFTAWHGQRDSLHYRLAGSTNSERAYITLREWARQAETNGDPVQAGAIRFSLEEMDRFAATTLQRLSTVQEIPRPLFERVMQRPPSTAAPAVNVPNVPMPAAIARRFDSIAAYKQLFSEMNRLPKDSSSQLAVDLDSAIQSISRTLYRKFTQFDGKPEDLPQGRCANPTKFEQAYTALVDRRRRLEESGDSRQARAICKALVEVDGCTSRSLQSLTRKYGPLDTLVPGASMMVRIRPETAGPPPADGATLTPRLQPVHPAPLHPGLHVLGEAAQAPPAAPTPRSAVSAPGTQHVFLSCLVDDFAVERALMGGNLPAGFQASQLIAEACGRKQFGVAEELAAGRLPTAAADAAPARNKAADDAGANALNIWHLQSLQKSIEHTLRATYSARADPGWLDRIRMLLRVRAEWAAVKAPAVAGTPAAGCEATGSVAGPHRQVEQQPDFLAVNHTLRDLVVYCRSECNRSTIQKVERAISRSSGKVLAGFAACHGTLDSLSFSHAGRTKSEHAYITLREWARQAEIMGVPVRAGAIRCRLEELDRFAATTLQRLSTDRAIPPVLFTRLTQRPSVAAVPAAEIPNIPMPSAFARRFDSIAAFQQLLSTTKRFSNDSSSQVAHDLRSAGNRIRTYFRQRFLQLEGKFEDLPRGDRGTPTKFEQAYTALENQYRHADESGNGLRARRICKALIEIDDHISGTMKNLTGKYSPLDALVPGGGPPHSAVSASGTPYIFPLCLVDDFAVERALIGGNLPPGFDASRLIAEARACAQFDIAEELAAGRLPTAAIDAALERNKAADDAGANALNIRQLQCLQESIERALRATFSALADPEWLDRIRIVLRMRAQWAAANAPGVTVAPCPVDDLRRLNRANPLHPGATAAMADIDWSAIEALGRILDLPPPPT